MGHKTKNSSNLNGFKTLTLVENLRTEVAKLLPKDKLWGRTLSYDKLSKYLGKNQRYLRSLKNRITNKSYSSYNPEYTFSRSDLDEFIKQLSKNFDKERIKPCEDLIISYKKEVSVFEYRRQQWQIHNPYLRFDAFKRLNTRKDGYYFGLLLADGLSDDGKNIGLFLEKTDKKVIDRFKKDLRISNQIEYKIDKRKKKNNDKYPEQYGVRVGCKPMMEDLKNLGYFRFKSGKALEEGFFTNLREDIRYCVLLGFYDGDGEKSTSKIYSTNRKFLEQVKKEFKITLDVRISSKSGENFVFYKNCKIKDSFYLSLGSDIFNKMMETYKYSMERKRKYYPLGPSRFVYETLREKIKTKENLERLILIGPTYKLMEAFNVCFETFKKLFKEWKVDPLPISFWKRQDNKDWENDFDEKLKQFLDDLSLK